MTAGNEPDWKDWKEILPQPRPREERPEEFLWPDLYAAHVAEFGPPLSDEEATDNFAMVLASVAERVDEEHLSNGRALAAIRRMIGHGTQPFEVMEALARLEACDNEFDFRIELGQESLRAYGLGE